MVSSQIIHPVVLGYAYPLRVRISGGAAPAFPLGCQLQADVRSSLLTVGIAGTLSTADGSIIRVDDDTIDLHMTAATTAAIESDFAVLDFARTDLSPPEWVGVQIELPVIVPATMVGIQ